ncbi:MAG: hypothetical protein U9Q67_03760 [Patescibacteria group bacterium]|nr:hypothetical protein [Patescibacteria group bacterium]
MRLITSISAMAVVIILAFSLEGCERNNAKEISEIKVKEVDLSRYSNANPKNKQKILFIHHSCGGQWLADQGSENEVFSKSRIYMAHPNGGGLRKLLEDNNYEVHEASYGSKIGDKTDICHWNAKFREQIDDILKCDMQDDLYDGLSKNQIVMFKSCYPNNQIESYGKEPGNPDSSSKTLANYKAAYNSILKYFRKYPDTLFVCITAPPLAQNIPSRTKEFIKNVLGSENSVKAMGIRAREFNNWLKDIENGWLSKYELKNVAVFDYYDILTNCGESNYSMYPTRGGKDSHPSSEGNSIAARTFLPFLNRAMNRLLKSDITLR